MPRISSYALQYSNVNFSTISSSTFDLFITEGDADSSPFIVPPLTDAQVATLTGQGRTIVGYVNVAVTDANRAYWQDSWTSAGPYPRDNDDLNPVAASAPAWLQSQPTNGFGVIVDFTDSAWQTIVINQAVALVQRGYSGVFLDDVGQYYTLGAPGGVPGINQMANLMCEFVADIAAAIKAVNPNAYVVVNSDPYLSTNVTSDAAGAQAAAAYLAAVDAHLLENQGAAAIDYAANVSLTGETRLILESDGSPAYSYADSWARGILYTAPTQSYNSLGSFAYPATAGADVLIGGNGPNQIAGLAGNDYLDGGAGIDTLTGNGGDDTFIVDNAGDRAIEGAGEGTDIVYASVSFTLEAGSAIEYLSTTSNAGTAAIDLTGNGFANTLYGNNGANTLRGGGGSGDTLIGLGGNDTYIVQGNEQAIEASGGGTDVVYTSVSYALASGQEIEILSTTSNAGTGAIDLTGNELANTVYGNNGANTLRGGGGSGDVLVGLGGNDTYIVQGNEQVVEASGGGADIVYTSVSHALASGQEVEILSTTSNSGTGAIDLTGNAFGNTIYGNNGANLLNGGSGNDVLIGFGGADTFAFTTALGAGNVDQLADFVSGADKIALDDAVFAGLGLGALPAGAFVTGSAAADADDRIVYNSATGQLFFDADGNGAGAMTLFATLQPGTTLIASDFQVI